MWGQPNTLLSEKYSASQWISLTFSGLAQGSIYALIALGYTLVYGILLMINFAHGEVYMAGAFTAYFAANGLAKAGLLNGGIFGTVVSILILLVVAGGVSMSVAILLERVAYRPLRGAPRLVPLITAIGASFFLQYTFKGFYGSEFKTYPQVDLLKGVSRIGGSDVPNVQFVVIVAAILLMLILYWMVERTKMGKAMRAVSENKEVSALMGIDIDRVIVFTFAIGGIFWRARRVSSMASIDHKVSTFSWAFSPASRPLRRRCSVGLAVCLAPCWEGCSLASLNRLAPIDS
ncbi:MAG: branched-chain amino acid ABC transporter permease [Caldilineaceae bacterium]